MSQQHRSFREVWSCFRRYALALLIGGGFAEVALLLAGHGPAVLAPLILPAVVAGGYGVIGGINRMINNDVYGWPEWPHVCHRCVEMNARPGAVTADRDEIREALATLRLPEDRP